MRYLEGVTLSARKGKRAMATGQTDDSDLDDYDLFMLVLDELDSLFAQWIDFETEVVTVNRWDNFCQFIMREEAAKQLLSNAKCMKMLDAAVDTIVPDAEIHITWTTTTQGDKI